MRVKTLVFALALLLPLSLLATPQAQNYLLTKTAPPASCATAVASPPTASTTFATTDPMAYLWFYVVNTNPGDVIASWYYTPSGQLYTAASGAWDALTTGGNWCFTDLPLMIAGYPPASTPGTWTVKVTDNGYVLFTLTFTIGAATPVLKVTINSSTTTACPNNKVNVTVTDNLGNSITGLTSSNFSLTEGGTTRSVTATAVSGLAGQYDLAYTSGTPTTDNSVKVTVTYNGNSANATTTVAKCSSGTPPVTGNLISNGDAESGAAGGFAGLKTIPGWTTDGNIAVVAYADNNDLGPTSPGPTNRGNNYFAGGPGNASAKMTQTIDLSTAATAIDAGTQPYTLDGWLGGIGGQDDNVTVTITFQNASGTTTGTATIGPVMNSDRNGVSSLIEKTASGKVPAGTRKALVTVQFTRTSGSDDDGLADNLYFGLTSGSGTLGNTFSFNGFSSTSGLTLVGSAATASTSDGTVLRLTPASGSQTGAAYSTTPITLGNNAVFNTQFQFRFTSPGGWDPADGITFVLTTNPKGLGANGIGMGYQGVSGNSVAIEFDTFNNAGFGIPNDDGNSSNHVSIDTNGTLSNTNLVNVYGNGSCGFTNGSPAQNIYTANGCMSNGHLWTVNIGYDGSKLTVTLSDPSLGTTFTAVNGYAINLATLLGQNTAYVGFTAGTGSGWENHDIVNWTFANTAPSSTSGTLSLNINQSITTACPADKLIVSVANNGSPVTGLTASNFALTEGGVSRNITVVPVTSSSSGALSLAIIIDVSGSLTGTTSDFNNEKAAAKQLISQLGSSDSAAIWEFEDTVTLLQDFTNDKTKLNAAVDKASGGGSTALYQAVQKAAVSIGARTGRKAIVLTTDGQDNIGGVTIDQAIAAAKTAGAPIFTVGIGSSIDATVLTKLATQTGGTYTASPTTAQLQAILQSIGQVISSQYEVSYTSGAPTTDNSVVLTVTSGSQTASATTTVAKCSASTATLAMSISQVSTTACPANTVTVVVTSGGTAVSGLTSSNFTLKEGSSTLATTVTAGSSGSYTLAYTSAATTTDNTVSITVTYNGQTATASQTVAKCSGSSTCTYLLQPQSLSVPAAGQSGSIIVITQSGCSTNPSSSVSWIHITGANTGAVSYQVDANSGSARTGTITIGNRTVTVTQDGGVTCTYSLNPTSNSVQSLGTTSSFRVVTTGASCTWSATISASWVHVTSATSGTGPATMVYTVDKNTVTQSRTATISVGGQTFSITQSAGAAANTPTVADNGIVNAASNRMGPVAQGSFFTIYGANIGPPGYQQVTSYPIPDTMGGVVVTVSQGPYSKRAFLHFVSSVQINGILPSDVPVGDVQMTVSYNGVQSSSTTITVTPTSFGTFSAVGGPGPGIVQNYNSATDQPLNLLSAPAKPGQIAILWGTGLGPITGGDQNPPAGGNLNVPVQVTVGGIQAGVLYQGRAPGFAGVDNIYFTVPTNAPLGCSVPVQVTAGGAIANTIRMAISADGKHCQDASNPVSTIPATGAKTATIGLLRMTMQGVLDSTKPAVNTTSDVGLAIFANVPAGGDLAFSQFMNLPPVGTCASNSKAVDFGAIMSNGGTSLDSTSPTPLDAGTSLTVSGPKGTAQLQHFDPNSTTAGPYISQIGGSLPFDGAPTMSSFLDPGNFTVTGTGGKDVGAFSASVTIGSGITWSNQSQLTNITRSSGFTVTWTGGDATQTVMIAGGGSNQGTKQSGGFICLAPGNAGSFAVPASVLQDIPVTGATIGTSSTIASLAVGALPMSTMTKFTAPGLDAGFIFASTITAQAVTVK